MKQMTNDDSYAPPLLLGEHNKWFHGSPLRPEFLAEVPMENRLVLDYSDNNA